MVNHNMEHKEVILHRLAKRLPRYLKTPPTEAL
jgi:hypothetical protein